LRDGVSLMPATAGSRERLEAIGEQVEAGGGTAWLLELGAQQPATEDRMRSSFDRSEAYLAVESAVAELRAEVPGGDEATSRRRLRQAQRDFESVARIDFFPHAARDRAREAVEEVTDQINRRFSPREPVAASGDVRSLDRRHYRGRLWATRRRLWVDRVASAWLIRRFIDDEARFVWLGGPEDCPPEALGFDFDGAAFTHVGERVTFEVLQASFGLEADRGLAHLGRLIRYLDVGGTAVAEAAGFEAVLAGMREHAPNDDALLEAVAPILDALYQRFSTTTN